MNKLLPIVNAILANKFISGALALLIVSVAYTLAFREVDRTPDGGWKIRTIYIRDTLIQVDTITTIIDNTPRASLVTKKTIKSRPMPTISDSVISVDTMPKFSDSIVVQTIDTTLVDSVGQ